MPAKSKANAKTTDTPVDFEKSLTELNELVERMEKGGLSLEQSLSEFEKGIKLIRSCQTKLQKAEQTVKKLVKEHGSDQWLDLSEEQDF